MDAWRFLDDLNITVHCISLIHRDDRFHASQKEFENVGLLARVKYYRPEKDLVDGRRGCWFSHKHIIDTCATSGPVLIFEDDIQFVGNLSEQLLALESFLRSKVHWDMVFMGGLIREIDRDFRHPFVYKATVLCTHAYIIAPHFIKILRNDSMFRPDLYDNLHIDYYYTQTNNQTFILKNECCVQNVALLSDNTLPILWANLCHGLRALIFQSTGWSLVSLSNWAAYNFGMFSPLALLTRTAEYLGYVS